MQGTFENRLTRGFLRFRRDRKGATAVEFALIALPFLALIFGILELGLIYLLSASLDNGMIGASRNIRTGRIIGTQAASASGFKTAICNGMGWAAADCQTNLSVRVEKLPNYAMPNAPTPLFDGSGQPSAAYTATKEGEIVLVRAAYRWKVFTPLLNNALGAGSNGYRLITSTLVFRNEPFGGG